VALKFLYLGRAGSNIDLRTDYPGSLLLTADMLFEELPSG